MKGEKDREGGEGCAKRRAEGSSPGVVCLCKSSKRQMEVPREDWELPCSISSTLSHCHRSISQQPGTV